MSFFKEKDGSLVAVDIYEKSSDSNTHIQGIQSQIVCMPFDTPYLVKYNGKVVITRASAHAKERAFKTSFDGFEAGDTDFWSEDIWNSWFPYGPKLDLTSFASVDSPYGSFLYDYMAAHTKKEGNNANYTYAWNPLSNEHQNRTRVPTGTNKEKVHVFESPEYADWTGFDGPTKIDLIRTTVLGNNTDGDICNVIVEDVDSSFMVTSEGPKSSNFADNFDPFSNFYLGAPTYYKKAPQKGEIVWGTGDGTYPALTVDPAKPDTDFYDNETILSDTIQLFEQKLHLKDTETKNLFNLSTADNIFSWHDDGIMKLKAAWRNVSFRDSYFKIQKPSLEMAYEQSFGEKTGVSSPVNVKSNYNFYSLPYEHAISDYHTNNVLVFDTYSAQSSRPIPEHMLPNIYALIYDQLAEDEPSFRYWDQGSFAPIGAWNSKKSATDPLFLNFTKENGNPYWFSEAWIFSGFVPLTWPKGGQLVDPANEHLFEKFWKPTLTPRLSVSEYLNDYIVALKEINHATGMPNPDESKPRLIFANGGPKGPVEHIKERKYTTIGMSAYRMKEFMAESSKIKKNFPMTADIELPAANQGPIGKILFDSGVADIFMQNIMAALYPHFSYHSIKEKQVVLQDGHLKDFMDSIKVSQPPVIEGVAIMKRDVALQNKEKEIITLQQDSLYSETVVKLWLNEFFENTKILHDLDDAWPAPKDSNAETCPLASLFQGVPSQYYDWITWSENPDMLEQILRLRGYNKGAHSVYFGGEGPLFSHLFDNNSFVEVDPNPKDAMSVLKPQIFGKKASQFSFEALFGWKSARKKIINFFNDAVRSPLSVFEGKEAHSEVLFYEIVKYESIEHSPGTTDDIAGYGIPESPGVVEEWSDSDGTLHTKTSYTPAGGPKPGTDSFLQNIFIPNVPGMDTLKYIDTQVKFDKGYYYQIYAHTLVVGTQYQYTEGSSGNWFGEPTEGQFDLHMRYKPNVHLFRVPFYNTPATMANAVSYPWNPKGKGGALEKTTLIPPNIETTLVWDSPPLFPDTVFLPLHGEKNKILLNNTFNVGEIFAEPIELDGNEEINTVKSRISQKKMIGPIKFRGDDFCGSIEILRLDKKPTSYKDFSPTSETRIATVGEGHSNFGFLDAGLAPNKNYYYIVREIDVHGNFSNPSPIYMIRIVAKDGEAPYPIYKIFWEDELEKDSPTLSLSFMKYIKIIPSMEQRVLNGPKLAAYSKKTIEAAKWLVKDSIGTSEIHNSGLKKVWDKKFRFRFTSKKTGKKFDLILKVDPVNMETTENKSTSGEEEKYSSGKCN